jgi:hypothetical protein
MKTPMQELFHRIEQLRFAKNPIDELMMIRLQMLEKEKAVIIEAFHEGMRCQGWDPNRGIAEEYYNETFNTKEKCN